MTGIGSTPSRPVGAEDVGDLQTIPGHDATGSGGRRLQMLERALDRMQGGTGDLGVTRRAVEFLVPEQHLDHPDIDLLLQEMGGEAMPRRMAGREERLPEGRVR